MSNCSASCTSVRSPLIAAIATFALKADVWFRRGLLLMLSPDSRAKSCPLSGRSSTYRPVQILEAGSDISTILHVSNNDGHSSSILDLSLHRDIWPDVRHCGEFRSPADRNQPRRVRH